MYLKIIALFLLLNIQRALPQESRGAILGRVTDASGALVPGTSVQVANVETGVVEPAQTNEQGNYSVPFLIPGTYKVTVEKAGFKRFVREGLVLQVADRVEVNISLELGALAETVNVSSENPMLDTAGASVGQVIDSKRIAELPISHGNPYLLMRLTAGLNLAGSNTFRFDSPWEPQFTARYAMAGSPAYRAEFTMDGASNSNTEVDAASAVSPAYTPPADAVSEFKVQTAVFDASMGQTEGGVVNVSIKSGTNAFHGTGYWAKQDPSMNANLFFANRTGQPRGDFQYNRLGGTFDGPILLPKVYNGRNRSFFLFAYENIHQSTPRGTTATVPTVKERTGDFSDLLKVGSNYQIYDPFTAQSAAGGRFTVQQLPGNIIPASRISPIAKNILSYFPLPSVQGTVDGRNNLPIDNWVGRVWYHTHLYRFDHHINDKNRLFLRFNFSNRVSVDSDWFGVDNPSLGTYFTQEASGFTLDDVHVFSSTFVMNLRLSDARFVRAQDSTLPGRDFDLTKLGLPASLRDAIDPALRRFPTVTITGYTALGPRKLGYRPGEARTAGATFDKIAGAHGLKFGVEYRNYLANLTGMNPTGGSGDTPASLTFADRFTHGPFDNSPASPFGQGLASMMFGVATGGDLLKPASYAELSTVWAGYLQDDWKLTRKLTLTLGLRYELEGPLTERFNRSVRGFDFNAQLPIEAQAKAAYAKNPSAEVPPAQFSVRGGVQFAGVDGQPRTLYEREKTNFMPRIGVAYSLTRRTVLRGGYGVYYGSLGVRRSNVIQTGFSQTTLVVPTLDGGLSFNATLANPFPDGILLPRGTADGTMTNVGQAVSFFNAQPRAPRLQKWQFGIQRELPGRFMVEARYLGSRGADLELTRSLNALPNQYLSTKPVRDQPVIDYLSANLPNPFNGLLPGTGRTGAVIGRAVLLAPFPQFSGITTTTNDGRSWYNSLNVEVQRRFAQGFTFQWAYTWSKFIQATTLLNDGDITPERVISPDDYPHHLAVSWVYELPFGRGRKFLNRVRPVADAILGGWQMSGIYTAQSGAALEFGDMILYGNIKDVPLSKDQRTIDRWFDTSLFERNSARQLARHYRSFSSRFNGIRGDGMNYWDASVMKNMKIREKVKLEFRAEALNVFNHVCFSSPNTVPTNTAFGTITSEMGLPRRLQMTLRVKF